MNLQELEQRLVTTGLSAYWQAAKSHVRNAVSMQTSPLKTLADLPLGASRIGGVPDLPPGMDWPMRGDWPLSFIAQINLAESHPFDTENRLPASGMLYLFYDTKNQPWGYDPKGHDGFKVLYVEAEPDTLIRATPPEVLLEDHMLDATCIAFSQQVDLPNASSHALRAFAQTITDDEYDLMQEWRDETYPAPAHKLLGHSTNLQGDMELECQLVSHGLYCGNASGYEDPRAQTLLPGAADWVLLMQIDSDDHCNWMWGDCGMLYVWIRKQDLAARRFDHCWVILQCF